MARANICAAISESCYSRVTFGRIGLCTYESFICELIYFFCCCLNGSDYEIYENFQNSGYTYATTICLFVFRHWAMCPHDANNSV